MACYSGQVKLVSLILVSLVNIDPGLLVKVDTKLHVPKKQVLGNKPELEISLGNMVSLTLIYTLGTEAKSCKCDGSVTIKYVRLRTVFSLKTPFKPS